MTARLVRSTNLAGLLASLILLPIGVFLGIFGDINAVAGWVGPAVHPAFLLIGVVGLHAVPAALFSLVMKGSPNACIVMLVLSPLVAWRGIYGLFVQADWGDTVLWGPYLLTGILMAATGLLLLVRRNVQ